MSTFNYETELKFQKINRFFIEQIPQLDVPIIDAKENCVTVGPYRVITNGKMYDVRSNRSLLYTFNRRSWGVGYALSLFRGDRNSAKQLINLNKKYEELDNEKFIYNHHIKISKKQKDAEKELVFENRLSRVDSEILLLEHRADTLLKSFQL